MTRARLAAALIAVLVMLLVPGSAAADHTQTSVFQDDQYLVYDSTATVEQSLETLAQLGAQVIRINVQWRTIAPDPLSTTEPAGFNATDPADYPSANWTPYIRIASLAPLFGMSVEFNITGPGPLWAMGGGSPTARAADHWRPNAKDFFDFVYALGTEFNGAVYGGAPRVSTWSIWNEPNQPGWLAPQWLKIKGKEVPWSAKMYRGLVDAAYYGLYFSGHAKDTMLIGETAPEGDDSGGFYSAMTPLPWLRDLYCVNGRDQPLRGTAAKAVGCPAKGPVKTFVQENRILFDATGYAHHPYDFFHSPTHSESDPNFIPLANIGRLERFLNSTFHTYGQHRQIPIYFTEYGYQTNPPDPYQVVTPAQQASYLNEADYMAWRNQRIRSVAQFLLYDAGPNTMYKSTQFDYWDTFQTGLLYANGDPKPAFYSYRVPIWIPQTTVKPGQSTFVWGQVRPADRLSSQTVTIEWRPLKGHYKVIGTTRTGAYTGYLTANVKLPGSGYVKIGWATAKGSLHSRAVQVTVS